MAKILGVSWQSVHRFETEVDTSDPIAKGYIRYFELSDEDLAAAANAMAVPLMQLILDQAGDPGDRALLLSRIARAAQDGFATRIPLAEGRWRPRPDLNRRSGSPWGLCCPECGRPDLVVTEGRHFHPESPDQLSFFPLRRHG